MPAAAPFKLFDDKGLYIVVRPNGGKWWRLDYRHDGKRKTLSMGTYPDTGLKEARTRRDEARAMIASGTDPAELRKAEKITLSEAKQEEEAAKELERLIQSGDPLPGSFRMVALEWISTRLADKTPKYIQKVTNQLERYVYPYLGNTPVADITAKAVLAVLRRVEAHGMLETMRKVKQHIGGDALRHPDRTRHARPHACPWGSTHSRTGGQTPRRAYRACARRAVAAHHGRVSWRTADQVRPDPCAAAVCPTGRAAFYGVGACEF